MTRSFNVTNIEQRKEDKQKLVYSLHFCFSKIIYLLDLKYPRLRPYLWTNNIFLVGHATKSIDNSHQTVSTKIPVHSTTTFWSPLFCARYLHLIDSGNFSRKRFPHVILVGAPFSLHWAATHFRQGNKPMMTIPFWLKLRTTGVQISYRFWRLGIFPLL